MVAAVLFAIRHFPAGWQLTLELFAVLRSLRLGFVISDAEAFAVGWNEMVILKKGVKSLFFLDILWAYAHNTVKTSIIPECLFCCFIDSAGVSDRYWRFLAAGHIFSEDIKPEVCR